MIPLFVSGIFIAGLVWLGKLCEPSGDKWSDYNEYQAFQREREKLFVMMAMEHYLFK